MGAKIAVAIALITIAVLVFEPLLINAISPSVNGDTSSASLQASGYLPCSKTTRAIVVGALGVRDHVFHEIDIRIAGEVDGHFDTHLVVGHAIGAVTGMVGS